MMRERERERERERDHYTEVGKEDPPCISLKIHHLRMHLDHQKRTLAWNIMEEDSGET